MKTLSKICVVSLACLTVCFASAESMPYRLHGATSDLFFAGNDPTTNSIQAVENCRTGGGLAVFEKTGMWMEQNMNIRNHGWANIADLVFDPAVNGPVPRFNLSLESQQQFAKLSGKLDHNSILADVVHGDGNLEPVTRAIKNAYAEQDVYYRYLPGAVVDLDTKSKGVSTLLALQSLHKMIVLATEQKKVCSPEFVEKSWLKAVQEVASLENCTIQFKSAVPFAAKGSDLNCDGQIRSFKNAHIAH